MKSYLLSQKVVYICSFVFSYIINQLLNDNQSNFINKIIDF